MANPINARNRDAFIQDHLFQRARGDDILFATFNPWAKPPLIATHSFGRSARSPSSPPPLRLNDNTGASVALAVWRR
ncbi:MAG: hypothetical protein ABL956_11145 [Hyphomonadaceae bacterium]